MKVMLNYLEIETCNLCNRKCPWCLFGQLPNFRGDKLQFLDTDYIEKIFHELNQNQFKGIISFYSMNEPLLDERIMNGSIFRLCRKILSYDSVKTKIHTNGILLNNKNIKEMLKSGLDKIFVSCYDVDMIHKIENLKNEYEEIEILDYTNENRNVLKYNRAGCIKSYNAFVAENKKTCPLPIFSSVIGFDGEIRICCNDSLGQVKIGNIKAENLFSILNSDKINKLRNKIITNREAVFPCNVCNFEEVPDYSMDFVRSSKPRYY